MEYSQYTQQQQQQQQQQQSQPQNQSQQQTSSSSYANSAAPGSITSPTNQNINSVQASPIVANQQQPQPQGHSMYQAQYGVPQQGMQGVHYQMPGIQAAAMAATAAASGSNYGYMASDTNISQTSPRMSSNAASNAKKDVRSSPRMNNIPQLPAGRRMSQVTSPGAVPNANSIMNHSARPGVAPPSIPQAQMHNPSSPEVPASSGAEESPLYVNAKQFHRILKRRVARQRLEEQLRLTSKGRKPYLHESRHNHAMRRPRGPGGRFLTAEEVAAMEREANKGPGDRPESDHHALVVVDKASGPAGTKRKSEDSTESTSKKAKMDTESSKDEEEEDDG